MKSKSGIVQQPMTEVWLICLSKKTNVFFPSKTDSSDHHVNSRETLSGPTTKSPTLLTSQALILEMHRNAAQFSPTRALQDTFYLRAQ